MIYFNNRRKEVMYKYLIMILLFIGCDKDNSDELDIAEQAKRKNELIARIHAYANSHWSPVRYALWTYDNAEALNNQVNRDNYDLFYGADMDSIRDQKYNYAPPFSEVYWDEVRSFERDIADGVTNGYTHQLPYYGQQQYYELIGKYVQFYAGWDDATDSDPEYNIEVPPSQFTASENSRFRIYSKIVDSLKYY